ncbi:MAG TPA: hypothetical protein VFM64_03450 [Candidatus Nitrosotenuis sp.]|nr:hypothetical protein [Candidatus Nitrosotenuis sp.]
MSYRMPKLEEIYDKIETEQNKPMSEADGYRWGLDYLKDIQKQLEKLEKMSLDQNNPTLYNGIKLSMQRALEAQKELSGKLVSLRK